MPDPELDIALFECLAATRPSSLHVPWGELAERLTRHDERAVKDGPGWSPTRYRDGATRSTAGVEAVSALVLDVDHDEPDWRLLAGLTFVAHTSHKHHAGHEDCDGRPDCPHWRIVLPLAAPMDPALHGKLWAAAKATICPAADEGAKGPARFFYLPSHPPGRACDTRRGEGALLDAARVIPDEPPEPEEDQPAASRDAAGRSERPGDRFNREASFAAILEPHGWTQVPHSGDGERWRRPGKSEGVSATADGGGHRIFYCFSSNAPPFQANTSYSRFGAFALLEHNGDFSAAGRELAARYRRNGDSSDSSGVYTSGTPDGSFEDESGDPRLDFRIGPFSVRSMRREDMRSHLWAHDGYVLRGGLNSVTGAGGAGKTTFTAFEVAGWTTGALPGSFHGRPIRVLMIGDEDDPNADWTPMVVAAGGDESYVKFVGYDEGTVLDLVTHAEHLERMVRRGGFEVVVFNQILDHLDARMNSHTQHDVRVALAPLRGLARRLGIAPVYTLHTNKISGAGSLRDKSGGSGQFTDLPRAGLLIGYHPDRDGWRAAGRGKGNVGRVPPTLIFRIEEAFVPNPATGEVISAPRIVDLQSAPDLAAEEILTHPARKREDTETAKEKAERCTRILGADGDWRPRKELAAACEAEGIAVYTFRDLFPVLATIETRPCGRETEWRLKA